MMIGGGEGLCSAQCNNNIIVQSTHHHYIVLGHGLSYHRVGLWGPIEPFEDPGIEFAKSVWLITRTDVHRDLCWKLNSVAIYTEAMLNHPMPTYRYKTMGWRRHDDDHFRFKWPSAFVSMKNWKNHQKLFSLLLLLFSNLYETMDELHHR